MKPLGWKTFVIRITSHTLSQMIIFSANNDKEKQIKYVWICMQYAETKVEQFFSMLWKFRALINHALFKLELDNIGIIVFLSVVERKSYNGEKQKNSHNSPIWKALLLGRFDSRGLDKIICTKFCGKIFTVRCHDRGRYSAFTIVVGCCRYNSLRDCDNNDLVRNS